MSVVAMSQKLSILKLSGEATIPARTEHFSFDGSYQVKMSRRGVMIRSVDPEFRKRLGGGTEWPTDKEKVVGRYTFERFAVFASTVDELIAFAAFAIVATAPSEMYALMKEQPKGPENRSRFLSTNENANLFLMGKGGELWIVSLRWLRGGWNIRMNPYTYRPAWPPGTQLFAGVPSR